MNWKSLSASIAVFLSLSIACSIFSSCAPTSPIVADYMTVSPQTLTYPTPDTLHTVALVHSCSCPVTYTITPLDTTATWLEVGPQTVVGDNGAFPVKINRSLLTLDTSRARLEISSNAYNTQSGNKYDTLMVIAIK